MASTENNPYASPRLPPEDGDPQAKRPSHFMSPAPVEGGEGDHPSPMRSFALRMYVILGAGLAVVYMAIAAMYPILGAALATIFLVVGLGLLTAKVVFRIDNPLKMWCWAPLFGFGWLLFLWILFRLKSLLW